MNEKDRAMFHALEKGRVRELRSALSAGANPNLRDSNGERPLTLAAFEARGSRLVKVLLHHGAEVELMNAVGQTPLMVAVAAGRATSVRLLLASGADVNRINRKKETALTYAVVWHRQKLVNMLLKHGAEVELPPYPACSPLMYAAIEGDSRTLGLLLRSGANTKRRDKYGRDARAMAHQRAVVRLLGG